MAMSYIDQLRTRLADINEEIEELDGTFKAGKISGDEYVDQRQRLKQTKISLEDELHRLGVVT
jgi:hypothetical protein